MELSGLCVTNSQAREIKQLYDDLLDYDKKPLVFKPKLQKPQRGRFACSKSSRSGYVNISSMKR